MNIADLFTDEKTVALIQARLPELFLIAELESSRAGMVGMEVGSARERILIVLLIYKFGEANVETDIPITETQVDVKLQGNPISIKTKTGRKLNGVKLVWTVDAEQAFKFSQEYYPRCDILLTQVNWNNLGWFFLFPKLAQIETLHKIERQRFFKLPKPGTNPRGVEISEEALNYLSDHFLTLKFPIKWVRKIFDYNPYERWLDLWKGN